MRETSFPPARLRLGGRWKGRRLQEPVAFAGAALVLSVAALAPLLALVGELASGDALASVRETLGSARAWSLLARSVGLAVSVTLGALCLGVPMGTLLAKTDVVGRRAVLALHAFPLFLPPLLLALGWFHWFGVGGLVGSRWTSRLLFGPLGVVGVCTLGLSPVVTALTMLGLARNERSLEQAALTVSRPLRVVTHVTLPLAWPSLALSALVVFSLSLSELGVPMFLRVRTYPGAVFTRLGGVDYAPGEAVALVLPLLAIGLALSLADRRLLLRGGSSALASKSGEPGLMTLGPLRLPVSIAAWGLALAPLLPLAAHAKVAGVSGMRRAVGWLGTSIETSLTASALAATAILVSGLILGRARVRRRPMASLFDALAVASFVVPSSALGVGMISAWNRPAGAVVYSSVGVLGLGLVARYAVLGVRAGAALVASTSAHHEESAAALGAGFFRRLGGILVPLHARGLMATWLLAFTFCMRDLDTVVVFRPPGLEPLPVRIFTLEANGPQPIVSALSLYQVLVTALALSLGGVLIGWRRRVA